MLPKIPVELLQTEIVHLLHVVEKAFLQNPNGILNGTLVFGLLHLGRKDNGVVVLSPLGIGRVQIRRNPVLVGNDGLLTVVAYDQRRDTAKILESIVVDRNPLRLLGRNHAFRIDEL